ncbi:hypothetical protein M405DRAFT_862643 [Rhizopogon salebrosus TDB-379]|nr:hypothetical protein M405DRAFT_862643 [Rhizopogon salebrosus TDB-379]
MSPFADMMINRLPTAPTNPSTTRLSIAQPAVNRLSVTDSTTNHTSAYSTAPTTTTVAPTTSTSCPPPRPSMDVYDKRVWRRTIDDVCTSSIEPSDAPCQQDDADILKALDGGISFSTNTIILRPPSLSLADTNHLNMTVVSNDPIWWPVINSLRVYSYFLVVSFTVVLYDWGEPCNAHQRNVDIPTTPALTFGQEFELVWVSTVA